MRRVSLLSVLGFALPLTAVLLSQELRAEDEPALSGAALERLVTELGADDFRTREEASKKLAVLGEKARPALEKAVKGAKSPETRWRAEQILRRLSGADRERPLGGESVPKPSDPRQAPTVLPGSGKDARGLDWKRSARPSRTT